MRNLKKAGAVALAAVMAVTFAPVASLNAFAASPVTVDNGAIKTAGEMSKSGTYTIDKNLTTGTIEITKDTEVTIDVTNTDNGVEFTVDNGATLTIIDSKTASPDELAKGTVGNIQVGSKPTAEKEDAATLVISGGHVGTVDIRYGDVEIDGGFVGGVKAEKTNIQNEASKQDNKAASSLTVTGGYLAAFTDDSTFGNTTAIETEDELIGSVKFTGGLFGFEVQKAVVKSGTDNKNHEKDIKGYEETTPIARFKSIAGLDGLSTAETSTDAPQGSVYAISNESIASAIALNSKAKAASDITTINGAVEIKDAPKDVTARVAVETKRGTTGKQTLSVTPAKGQSMLTNTQKSPENAKTNYTTTTTYWVGKANLVASNTLVAGTVPEGGTFTNGGDTLEVEVDGTDYVASESDIERAVATGKEVTIKELAKSDRFGIKSVVLGDTDFTLTDATTIKADPAYTIVSTYGNDGRHVVVSEATNTAVGSDNNSYVTIKDYKEGTNKENLDDATVPDALATDAKGTKTTKYNDYVYGTISTDKPENWEAKEGKTTNGANVTSYKQLKEVYTGMDYGIADENAGENVNKVVVEQVGTKHGFEVLANVPSTAKVSTVDTTIPVAYSDTYYYIGADAIQYAVSSKEGEALDSKFKVEKTSVPKNIKDKTIVFTQGSIVMHEVASARDEGDISKEATDLTYVDGANLGISKKWNYSTSVYTGVQTITSADVTVGGAKDVEPVTLYRIYNSITGEHFYTTSKDEVDAAIAANVGWTDETPAEGALKVLPATTDAGVTVYRIHNTITGEHLFSTSKTEIADALAANVGWEDEGVAFKGAENGTSVYRLVLPMNNNTHLFTSSNAEIKACLESPFGWKNEGVSFYSFQ